MNVKKKKKTPPKDPFPNFYKVCLKCIYRSIINNIKPLLKTKKYCTGKIYYSNSVAQPSAVSYSHANMRLNNVKHDH